MTTPIQQALALGQSFWYDDIRRSLLTSGELECKMKQGGLRDMTSNPSIFDAAIAGSSDDSDAIVELRRSGLTDAKSVYESLADIHAAVDIFRPVYDVSDSVDGCVSMEVSSELAHDTAATRLWGAGVPATDPHRGGPHFGKILVDSPGHLAGEIPALPLYIVLTIPLSQECSPESKQVTANNETTGEANK